MSQKRNLIHADDEQGGHKRGATPRAPPLKKRFIPPPPADSSTNSTSISIPMQDDPKNHELPESLSKKQLLEHMRVAKELVDKERQMLKDAKCATAVTDSMMSTFRIQVSLLRDQCAAFPTVVALSEQSERTLLVQQLKQVCLQIVEYIQAWCKKMSQFEISLSDKSDVDEAKQFLQFEMDHLESSDALQIVKALEQKNSDRLNQITALTNDIASVNEKLQLSGELLDEYIQNISTTEKRQERLQSKVVSEVLGGEGGAPQPQPQTEKLQEQHKEDEQYENDASRRREAIAAESIRKNEIAEYHFLLESRKQNLVRLQEDKDQLNDKIDHLLSRFYQLNNDYIRSRSDYVNHLQSLIELDSQLSHYYEQRKAKLLDEKDSFTRERREMIDQHNSEMASRESIYETERKRLQDTTLRVRSQRDDLQEALQRKTIEEQGTRIHNQKVIEYHQEQKNRMDRIEREILDKRQASVKREELEDCLNYRKLQTQIDKTHGILHALLQNEQKGPLSDLKTTTGLSIGHYEGEQLHSLDQLVHQRQELTLLIDFFEKTEASLYAQMDCDGHVFERQMIQINRQLQDKKLIQTKLQAEINKYATINHKLVERKHDNDIKYVQQCQKLQLHEKSVLQLQEKIASIETTVVEKEKSVRQQLEDTEHSRLKLDDISQECAELQAALERNNLHITELQDMAREKTRSLEQETLLVQQAKVEYERVNKKWSMIQQGENPASQELIEEVEELRARFKCNTCKIRRRECILTSCMHTFCNECIKIRLNTRQRRCPSCAITFGASDVKTIYLYDT